MLFNINTAIRGTCLFYYRYGDYRVLCYWFLNWRLEGPLLLVYCIGEFFTPRAGTKSRPVPLVYFILIFLNMEDSVYFNFFSDLNTIRFSLPTITFSLPACLRWLLLLKENFMSSRECSVSWNWCRGGRSAKSAKVLWLCMPMLDQDSRGSGPLIGELLPGIQ